MKKLLSILAVLALSAHGTQASDTILIPQLADHPRSIDMGAQDSGWKSSTVFTAAGSSAFDERYAVKFDGGVIVDGAASVPMIVTRTSDDTLIAISICKILPICKESPTLLAGQGEQDPTGKGIDLVDFSNNSPAVTAALADAQGLTDHRQLAARLDDGAQLYQLKGMAILAQEEGRDPLFLTKGEDNKLVAFSLCRIIPICTETFDRVNEN